MHIIYNLKKKVINYNLKKKVTHVQLCNTMDCSPPGSSAHEILHTKILE